MEGVGRVEVVGRDWEEKRERGDTVIRLKISN